MILFGGFIRPKMECVYMSFYSDEEKTRARPSVGESDRVPPSEVLSPHDQIDRFNAYRDRLGVDVQMLMAKYGVDSYNVQLQSGGRNPDVIWVRELPALDIAKLLQMSSPLYSPETPEFVKTKAHALELVRRRRVVTVGQVWLAYESADYYVFSGGDVEPIFDFSVGSAVRKDTGEVVYWYRDKRHSERPVLRALLGE